MGGSADNSGDNIHGDMMTSVDCRNGCGCCFCCCANVDTMLVTNIPMPATMNNNNA